MAKLHLVIITDPNSMRRLLILLSMAAAIHVQAATTDPTRIDTRYGQLDTVERADTTTVRFRGKTVGMLPAFGASLYRITQSGPREFVIVDGWTPGLHCHHVFLLVEVFADGNAAASKPFGECKELQGAEMRGETPVVRLGEPYIPERGQSLALTDFEWKNGTMVRTGPGAVGRTAAPAKDAGRPLALAAPAPAGQAAPKPPAPKSAAPAAPAAPVAVRALPPKAAVPAAAAASVRPVNKCSAAADAATAGGTAVDVPQRSAKVIGQGRLPFLSAPDAACEQPGIFIVSGDAVQVERRFGEYAYVRYVNPKSGKGVQGWVAGGRLGGAVR